MENRYKAFRQQGFTREFRITYTITTTTGEVFSHYGQYYNYNPSLDGRRTGRYAQFYTNLPRFGMMVLEGKTTKPSKSQ